VSSGCTHHKSRRDVRPKWPFRKGTSIDDIPRSPQPK
jgi:hypothetical protein